MMQAVGFPVSLACLVILAVLLQAEAVVPVDVGTGGAGGNDVPVDIMRIGIAFTAEE